MNKCIAEIQGWVEFELRNPTGFCSFHSRFFQCFYSRIVEELEYLVRCWSTVFFFAESADGLCCKLSQVCGKPRSLTWAMERGKEDDYSISRDVINRVKRVGSGQFADVWLGKDPLRLCTWYFYLLPDVKNLALSKLEAYEATISMWLKLCCFYAPLNSRSEAYWFTIHNLPLSLAVSLSVQNIT